MDELIFFEVAHELKALHKAGVDAVARRDFERALDAFQKALTITRTIGYGEGSGHACWNLAGVYALQGRLAEALRAHVDARDAFALAAVDCAQSAPAIAALCLALKKRGVEHEKAGRFHAAIECFTAAIPHADPKSRSAMEHEVTLLKRIVDEAERANRAGTQGAQP